MSCYIWLSTVFLIYSAAGSLDVKSAYYTNNSHTLCAPCLNNNTEIIAETRTVMIDH